MSSASVSPATPPRRRRRVSFRKLAAWLASRATSPRTDLWLVITFAVVHALLWTRILIDLKAAQDVHMDVLRRLQIDQDSRPQQYMHHREGDHEPEIGPGAGGARDQPGRQLAEAHSAAASRG